jgi:RNA polymerase sigma-70 factor (ECF subfamily)
MIRPFGWWLAVVAALTGDGGKPGDEAGWVARAASGDGAALGWLSDRHARAVYSLALRVLSDESDAEDVVQEVFAQAWRQASRYDASRGPVVAWLLTMTRTRAIDRIRARRARPDTGASAGDDRLPELALPLVDPVEVLDAAQDAARVRTALQDLPALQRLAIELAFFEGLTQSEVAERLEQPLGTVKTRIRLGLLKLRDALTGTPAGGPA